MEILYKKNESKINELESEIKKMRRNYRFSSFSDSIANYFSKHYRPGDLIGKQLDEIRKEIEISNLYSYPYKGWVRGLNDNELKSYQDFFSKNEHSYEQEFFSKEKKKDYGFRKKFIEQEISLRGLGKV